MVYKLSRLENYSIKYLSPTLFIIQYSLLNNKKQSFSLQKEELTQSWNNAN